MLVYNTLTEKKEKLVKPKSGPLKLFVCGPTVYDSSHIGHAKTFIAFDVIARYLRVAGFKLIYLQNITDVDDKIIERAKKEKKLPHEIARHFEQEFHEDMKNLNVISVDHYARASEFISAIQKQIKTLIKKGFAYATSSGVYFEIKKYKKYGQLSKQNLAALRPGYRIEPDPEKKDPLDFALWKISDEEPNWPSPWGQGRPGWHIEDTAVTEEFFGPQYDLHGGGLDLKFPHHESEIAQQEAASGKNPFVKIWLHTGFVLINNEKMSKSLKNIIAIGDFIKQHSPLVLRLMVAGTHYRSPFNYTEDLTKQTKNTLVTLIKFVSKLELISHKAVTKKTTINLGLLKETEKKFHTAMADDFNTPEALAAIFSLINHLNDQMWKITAVQAKQLKKSVSLLFDILGLDIKSTKVPENIKDLAVQRESFRQKNNFKAADELRKHIIALGYNVEDTPAGPLIIED